MLTPEFRVNYAHVLKPDPETDMYNICCAISKSLLKKDPAARAAYEEIKAAVEAAVATAFPNGCKRPSPFKDGDQKPWKGDGVNPFVDTIYFDVKTKFTPECFDRNRKDIISEDEFYNGCYARARVHVYTWQNNGGGASIGFDAVQKLRDGERIQSAKSAKDSFDDLPDTGPAEVTSGEDDLLI